MESRTVRIKDLKNHPMQKAVFGDLPDDEFQVLMEDINENGLNHPPEVAPDMTIISGHQRVRAWQQLGHTKIAVVVREGLDDHQIDQRFIEDNLHRRHLDPVGKARAFKALFDVERAKKNQRFWGGANLEFRDYVAAKLGCSGRTADRYLQLLRLPMAIQDAVSRGELGLTTAIKVDSFSREQKQQIIQRIEDGESTAAVVKELVAEPKAVVEPYTAGELFEELLEIMYKYLPEFESSWKNFLDVDCSSGNTMSVLERSGKLFNNIYSQKLALANSSSSVNKTSKACKRPRKSKD